MVLQVVWFVFGVGFGGYLMGDMVIKEGRVVEGFGLEDVPFVDFFLGFEVAVFVRGVGLAEDVSGEVLEDFDVAEEEVFVKDLFDFVVLIFKGDKDIWSNVFLLDNFKVFLDLGFKSREVSALKDISNNESRFRLILIIS